MSSLQVLTGRDYLSYSSLSSWLDCGERFRLERVLNAPQSDAWWFIGGDAVHKATEDCDIDGITSEQDARTYWDTIWQTSISRLYDDGVDLSTIKAGGRKSAQWPDKENQKWWEVNGPEFVVAWVKWRERVFQDGWQFHQTDTSSGIEVRVEIEFPDVRVKGYIDRVMVNRHGQLVVVDLKSGHHVPASSLQLGIYALGYAQLHNVTPSLGAYWMARNGDISEPTSLLHYTFDTVGGWFAAAKRGIEAEVFIPHVGPLCRGCSVAPYCRAVGGDPGLLALGNSAST